MENWGAARELGLSTLELSKRLDISQPAASQSVKQARKDREREGTQTDKMTCVNRTIPVPMFPRTQVPSYPGLELFVCAGQFCPHLCG